MNFEKYIGIPYADKGRDVTGIDCWGLVRLVYKDELNIDLPSFVAEYTSEDDERIEELFAQYKEGWESVDKPNVGDVVVFRMLGYESHIGVVVNDKQFLHVRENQDSVIESLDNPKWVKRIVGFFKYSEKHNAILNTIPHPLKTERYTLSIIPGINVSELVINISSQYNVPAELKSRISVIINGRIIAQEKWSETVINENDVIEYRAVPGKDAEKTFRTIAVIALAVYAPYLATQALGYAASVAGAAGLTIGATAGAVIYYGAMAAVTVLGTSLINAIAPIRPPVAPTQNDPGSSTAQLMVTGGNNRATPYSAIPVVLGKVRVTPPLGAINYLTYENERDSYISMLLTWGYGPLVIDESSLKIGDIGISNFDNYSLRTLNRISEPTTTDLNIFNGIYGNDVTQVQKNITIACAGNPESVVTPGPWYEAATTEKANTISIAIHFPQGLRKIKIKGDGSGNAFAAPVTFRLEYTIDGSNWTFWKTLTIGSDTPKKDAFTWTESLNDSQGLLSNTQVTVRIRRETGDNTEDNPDYRYYHTSVFQVATFIRNARPAVDPVGVKIAKSAFKIKATDQINGSVEGISAIVQTYAKSWNGSAWVDAATNNPADLFRYVLEHPANPRRITDASTQIDLTAIQYWAQYCNTRGFTFNSVMGEARSVLDVLRDICAAGRASPAIINGKWSVTIDEEKTTVIQHFTPHNSWGFEATKALPKLPDGLRVTYYDESQNYQQAEVIVYNVGKNIGNASLFESIPLPGVTKVANVIDHAKWNMAQIKLRPEVYTLNVDIEYLVCNRGDRVKVMHDVPLWGIGSGRVKNVISTMEYELDEEIPMVAGVTYTIRFRSKTGSSTTRNIVPVITDGMYSVITLDTGISTTDADVLDLFLVGELNQESQDLIVLGIEPADNKSARLTLIDYGVTDTYNIFTDYLTLTEATVFESQITLPPSLQQTGYGDKVPTITGFVSDESVMNRIGYDLFQYNMNVAYVNAVSLPNTVETVEVQYNLLSATDSVSNKSVYSAYETGNASITDVIEGATYKVRARYVGKDGRIGKWSGYSNHTVIGKVNPPSTVTGFAAQGDKTSGQLLLSWANNPEVDVIGYEIRLDNSGWALDDSYRVFLGDATTHLVKYSNQPSTTFYIKAIDSSGNYSVNSISVTYTPDVVPNTADIQYVYSDTSLTNATITLTWDEVTTSEFIVDYYEISYDTIVKTSKSNTITLPTDWVGDKVFTVKTVDIHSNKSVGFSKSITKFAPNPVTNFRTQVIDNTIMFYWDLPAKTTLPIDHVLIKKGPDWSTAEVIGEKKGNFTTLNEFQGGVYTYWIATVDTSGEYSTPINLTSTVSEPPDFVFHGEFITDFTATKSSALLDNGSLLIPVNITETWQGHFTTHGWTTPQDQVSAGYPIFIQPAVASGYYEEVFDFGQPLASSKISLIYKILNVTGSPLITPKISLSLDNVSYVDYNGATDVFGTNFRYVKVRITVDSSDLKALCEITNLSVRLDAKLKNDAGNISALSSDSLGTIINFNKEFIDIQSVTVSPSGTTPVIPVYDIKDAFVSGTYSVTSNVCTVTISNHGMITGQKVKLFITSSTGVSGVYTVTSYTTNTFTVAMTTSNTSGNCSMYPQSFRVYLFDNTGARVSATTSWSIKGY